MHTEGEIIWGKTLGASEGLAAVVAECDYLCLDAHPAEVSLEGAGYVGLATSWKTDGDDEDLASMEEQTRRGGVQRCDHGTRLIILCKRQVIKRKEKKNSYVWYGKASESKSSGSHEEIITMGQS